MEQPIRLALVEDHTVFRQTLAAQLGQEPRFEICGDYGSAAAFLQALPALSLDVVLMDISLPDRKGYQVVADALAVLPQLRILFLTAHEDTDHYRAVVQAGGHGYVPKSATLATLTEALVEVAHGGQFFSPEQLQALVHPPETSLEVEGPPSPFDRVLQDSVWIRSQDQLVRLRYQELLWVEAAGNYSTLVTTDRKHVIVSSLRHTAEKLPAATFMRVHKSYLVNLSHIDRISDLSVFIGDTKIPVGRTYRARLLEQFNQIR
ncbi:MAG: LytTR family transcriptional regulator DNA-binding domain-containing protein [Bacteroidota bacterium]